MLAFVLTVIGLMLAASTVNAEEVTDFRMCRSEYGIDTRIGYNL